MSQQLVVIGSFIIAAGTDFTQDASGITTSSAHYPQNTLATLIDPAPALPSDFTIGGYLYIGGQYVRCDALPTSIQKAKTYVLADLSAFRWSKMTGGTTINGIQLTTDLDSLSLIQGANATAILNPGGTTNFKAVSGWISIPNSQFPGFFAEVSAFIQKCYNVEKGHAANINALSAIDDIFTYDYTTGWQ